MKTKSSLCGSGDGTWYLLVSKRKKKEKKKRTDIVITNVCKGVVSFKSCVSVCVCVCVRACVCACVCLCCVRVCLGERASMCDRAYT